MTENILFESTTKKPVEVFYSYAHEDEGLRDELKKHLANLKRQGVITDWYDRDISAGRQWDDEIKSHLDSASVILLLISPDFMNSDYCNDVEVRRAMERHDAGEARVVPVILRPVDWTGAPFSKLQSLPTDVKPITLWHNRDEAFLDVTRGIRKALKDLSSIVNQSSVTAEAQIPRPPIVGFVARRDSEGRNIVDRLKEELAPEKNQLIVLSGPGGVGKTTLAAEAARELSKLFKDRLVWTSALGREDFAFTTLLDEIATQLSRADLRTLAPEPKAEQVQSLIASETLLIVVDNFETIGMEEQKRCIEFLLNRASCPALITTRQKVTSARNITIPVMLPEEADDFLNRLIEQTSNTSAFAGLDRDRVMQASERNPLVMQWVISQIDLAQEANTVLDELAKGSGDIAERVFERSFRLDWLGDDGRATLLALSMFAPNASRPALAEVAGFEEDPKQLNDAVKRLASLYLIKVAGGQRLTIEGLTRELAKSRLSKDTRAPGFRRRFVEYFMGYAQANSKPTPDDFDALETERDNILSAMDVAFGLRDWSSVIGLMDAISFDGVNGFLSIRGYWEDAIQRGEQTLQASRNLGTHSNSVRFSHNLGIAYANRGDIAQARRLYAESLEIVKRLGDQGLISISLHQHARLAEDQGHLEEARRLYNESLEIKKRLGDQAGLATSLHQLGRLAQELGDLHEARRLFNQSLDIARKLGDKRAIASSLHNLARLALDLNELDETRQLLNESLDIKKKLGDQRGISNGLQLMALLAHGQGELDEARRLYNESLKINEKLGNQSRIATNLHQLARVAEDEGNNADAIRLFEKALTIYEKLNSPYAQTTRQSLVRVQGKDERVKRSTKNKKKSK